MMTVNEYKQALKENISLLEKLMEGDNYPELKKVLARYNNNMYNKLINFHRYLISYGSDIRQRWSYNEYRGYEALASMDTLVSLYKGSKSTWNKVLKMLYTLQLISVYKPRTDDNKYFNTDVQQCTVNRAMTNNANACNWYHIPIYNETVLASANDLCEVVQEIGSGIDKDSIRDALGEEYANKVTDTGYNEHPETTERRNILKETLIELLKRRGYTTEKELLSEAKLKIYGSKYRWEQTYKSYKRKLFEEIGVKCSRPTKAEKEIYGLYTDGYIIRYQ